MFQSYRYFVLIAAIGGLAACVTEGPAQPQAVKEPSAAAVPDSAVGKRLFATCQQVEVTTSTSFVPVGERAVAGCDTGGGGVKSCSVTLGVTQPGYVFNRGDTTFTCQKLDGDNPCAFVQAGPLQFTSDTGATRTFTTNSDRVTLTQTIGQKRPEQTVAETPVGQVELYFGQVATIKRLRSATSVRLECKLSTGATVVGFVDSQRDLFSGVKFLSRNTSDPSYDFYQYQVQR